MNEGLLTLVAESPLHFICTIPEPLYQYFIEKREAETSKVRQRNLATAEAAANEEP